MAYTAADLEKLKKARIDLASGKMKAKVRTSDREVSFAPSDAADLDKLIDQVEAQLRAEAAGGSASRHGCIRPGLGTIRC